MDTTSAHRESVAMILFANNSSSKWSVDVVTVPNDMLAGPCGVAHQQQDLHRDALVEEL